MPRSDDRPPDVLPWARALLTLLLAVAGWHAFHDEYGTVPLVSDIDLAIHEFGHMLFMPFGILVLGKTMMILGGSLIQVVVPCIFVGYFLKAQGGKGDLHAATVCLWWVSINLLGVAIYMNDARAGVLMLITGETGQESDAHDWNNLFRTWGVLSKDTLIAGRVRILAGILFGLSILGGLYAAWTQRPASTPSLGSVPGRFLEPRPDVDQ